MIIRITEKCEVEELQEGENNIREIEYYSECETLEDGLADYVENFDIENIESSDDGFEGECLDSEIIKCEIMQNIY